MFHYTLAMTCDMDVFRQACAVLESMPDVNTCGEAFVDILDGGAAQAYAWGGKTIRVVADAMVDAVYVDSEMHLPEIAGNAVISYET